MAAALLSAADHVYFLNLDRSKERRSHMESQLEAAGLSKEDYWRVPAVDGSKMLERRSHAFGSVVYLDEWAEVVSWDLETVAGARGVGSKTVSVLLSHLRAIHTAYMAGDRIALVLEDDVDLSDGELLGAHRFPDLLAQLPPDWTLLQASYIVATTGQAKAMQEAYWSGGELFRHREPCGSDWTLWGAHAYFISRRGMRQVLRRLWPGGALGASEAGGRETRGKTTVNVSSGFSDEGAAAKGSAASAPPLVFDLRGLPNHVADYALFYMPGVYIATQPAMLPPLGFLSTLQFNDTNRYMLERSRTLLGDAFPTSPSDAVQLDASAAGIAQRSALGTIEDKTLVFPPPLRQHNSHEPLKHVLTAACQDFGPGCDRQSGAFFLTKLWAFWAVCGRSGGPGKSTLAKQESGATIPGARHHASTRVAVVSAVAQFQALVVPRNEADGRAAAAAYCHSTAGMLAAHHCEELVEWIAILAGSGSGTWGLESKSVICERFTGKSSHNAFTFQAAPHLQPKSRLTARTELTHKVSFRRRMTQHDVVDDKGDVARKPAHLLVEPVPTKEVIFGAAATGAVLGYCLSGTVAATVLGGAAAIAAGTDRGRAGEIARSSGTFAFDAYRRGLAMDEHYGFTRKGAELAQGAVERIRVLNAEHQPLEKGWKLTQRAWQQACDANDRYQITNRAGAKASEFLGADNSKSKDM